MLGSKDRMKAHFTIYWIIVLSVFAIGCSTLCTVSVKDENELPLPGVQVFWSERNVQILRRDRTGSAITRFDGTCQFNARGNVYVEAYSSLGYDRGDVSGAQRECALVLPGSSASPRFGIIREGYMRGAIESE